MGDGARPRGARGLPRPSPPRGLRALEGLLLPLCGHSHLPSRGGRGPQAAGPGEGRPRPSGCLRLGLTSPSTLAVLCWSHPTVEPSPLLEASVCGPLLKVQGRRRSLCCHQAAPSGRASWPSLPAWTQLPASPPLGSLPLRFFPKSVLSWLDTGFGHSPPLPWVCNRESSSCPILHSRKS